MFSQQAVFMVSEDEHTRMSLKATLNTSMFKDVHHPIGKYKTLQTQEEVMLGFFCITTPSWLCQKFDRKGEQRGQQNLITIYVYFYDKVC